MRSLTSSTLISRDGATCSIVPFQHFFLSFFSLSRIFISTTICCHIALVYMQLMLWKRIFYWLRSSLFVFPNCADLSVFDTLHVYSSPGKMMDLSCIVHSNAKDEVYFSLTFVDIALIQNATKCFNWTTPVHKI